MGDLIEFSTWPNHQHIFYRITSGALAFYVKGESYAAVGLTRKPSDQPDYKIVISSNQCWIENDTTRISNIMEVPNILPRNSYGKLWISWHGGVLQFGRTRDGIPLLNKKIPLQDLHFVTFSSYTQNNTGAVQWKFYLPPKLEQKLLMTVKGSDMQWVEADERLPSGAFIGGYENEMLYIIRAPHRGSLTPGKFVPSQGAGVISWGGESHEKEKFEVLCGCNCIWVPTHGNRIPIGAVEAGHSEVNHETLYIGRAATHGHLIPGKVQPSHNVCYIPYNDEEISKRHYEILVNPQKSLQSPLRYSVPQMDQAWHVASVSDNEQDYDDANGLWEFDEASSESDNQ